jgi:hypothetical protein
MKINELKQKHKFIIKRPSGMQPQQFDEAKLENFIKNNYKLFKKYIYLGWVKRTFPVDGRLSAKKELRFFVATSDEKKELKKLHKSGEEFGANVWDVT